MGTLWFRERNLQYAQNQSTKYKLTAAKQPFQGNESALERKERFSIVFKREQSKHTEAKMPSVHLGSMFFLMERIPSSAKFWSLFSYSYSGGRGCGNLLT